jgi:hypothetical protein
MVHDLQSRYGLSHGVWVQDKRAPLRLVLHTLVPAQASISSNRDLHVSCCCGTQAGQDGTTFSQAVEEAAGDHRPVGRTVVWETPEGVPQLPMDVTPQQLQQQLQMVRPFLLPAPLVFMHKQVVHVPEGSPSVSRILFAAPEADGFKPG